MGEAGRRNALKPRNIFLVLVVALAAAGVGLGFSQACNEDPPRDEAIRNYKRTITASERRIDRAQTAIAILTQTPATK